MSAPSESHITTPIPAASMSGLTLPLVLKAAIIKELERAEPSAKEVFLTCRLVSKEFRDLATPRAFHTLKFSRKKGTYAAFAALPPETSIFEHVRELKFRALETDENEMDADDIEETAEIFTSLSRCPNLHKLRLDFPRRYQEEEKEYDAEDTIPPMSATRRLQIAIFTILVNLDPPENSPFSELEVWGLLTLPNSGLRSLKSRSVSFLKSVQYLTISVVTNDRDEFEMQYDEDYLSFWNDDMTCLLSSTENLVYLVLLSDVYTSSLASPGTKWHKLTLPNLKSLMLDQFVFTNAAYYAQEHPGEESYGLEEFIVRHNTLTALNLSSCVLEIGEHDTSPRSWADVWNNLRLNLPKLRKFEVDPMPGRRHPRHVPGQSNQAYEELGYDDYDGYAWFHVDVGFVRLFKEPPCDADADTRAFEALKVAVDQNFRHEIEKI